MTLTFTQENGLYVAEFEATAPFSIHLERPNGGFINMLQRSVDSGTFVAVKNFNPNYNATQVIDADCGQGAVYPKWIRLESAVEPSVAEVTFESESSGGGAGTESTMEYLDVSGLDKSSYNFGMLARAAYLIRVVANNTIAVGTYGVTTIVNPDTVIANITSIAIDFKTPIISQGQLVDNELLVSSLYSSEELAAIPRITEEQFYSLEA